jgi:phage-related protein
MASVVATQMKKCLSSVQSYMSQIAKATNKKMNLSVNVNRTVTTKNVSASTGTGGSRALSADALYAANTASTYSLGRNMGALASRASSVSSSSVSSSSNGRSSNDGLILEMPVYLDGKEVARATAKYVDGELKRISSRENRKRGAK